MRSTKLVREESVERNLVKQIQNVFGEWASCDKYATPGRRGSPDRIVLVDGGHCFFVELKSPTGQLRPEQIHEHKRLRDLEFYVFVVRDSYGVTEVIRHIRKLLGWSESQLA